LKEPIWFLAVLIQPEGVRGRTKKEQEGETTIKRGGTPVKESR